MRVMSHAIEATEHLLYFPHDVNRDKGPCADIDANAAWLDGRINHRATRRVAGARSTQPPIAPFVWAGCSASRRSDDSTLAYDAAHRAVWMRTSRRASSMSAVMRSLDASIAMCDARTISRHARARYIRAGGASQGIRVYGSDCETRCC